MRHEIIHGDCAEVLGDYIGLVDLIVTSPPYDDAREFGGQQFDFDAVADACVGALRPGGVLVWDVNERTLNGARSGTSLAQVQGFIERGLCWRDTVAFVKTNPRLRDRSYMMDQWEPNYIFTKGPSDVTFNPIRDRVNKTAGTARPTPYVGRREDGSKDQIPIRNHTTEPHGWRSNVWVVATGWRDGVDGGFKRAYEHPAIFPFNLARDHIRIWSNEGDLVVDPMCGSGTTVDAARRLARNAIGIEIHGDYVQLARQRLAQRVLV